MENLNDLFNLQVEDLAEQKSTKTDDLFKPTAEKGKEGVYSALVKFIPWHENPKKSVMSKWSCWLEDPLTNKGRYVDCPSTIGKKSVLQDMYWKLKKSNSVAEQKLAQVFSRRRVFASVVQIISDKNSPDNEGKLMIWKYGVKVHNKIQEQMQPEYGQPHIPYDLFDGKLFHLKITKVSGFNNYDNSKFLDERKGIMIDGKDNWEKNPEDMKAIIEYLKANSPNLNGYDYREWDADTIGHVNSVISNTVPNGQIVSELDSNAKPAPLSNASIAGKTTLKTDKVKAGALDDFNDLEDLDSNFDDDLYAGL